MKQLNFLAVAFVALMAASCQKENVADDSFIPIEKAKLTVRFASDSDAKGAMKTKAYTSISDEGVIKDAVAFVFRSNGELDVPAFEINAASTDEITNNDVTTHAKVLVIIANAGVSFTGTTMDSHVLKDVKKFTDLRDKLVGLTANTDGTGAAVQTSTTGLLMSGTGVITMKASNAKELVSTVTMKYVSSFITVNWDTSELNDAVGAVAITGIAILNVSHKTRLVPAMAAVTTTAEAAAADLALTAATVDRLYLEGLDMAGAGNVWAVEPSSNKFNEDVLFQAVTNQTPSENANGFYVFENDTENGYQTIVVLTANWTPKGGNATPTYYPVHFTADQATGAGLTGIQSIVRGQKYTVTMKIKNIGVDDPTLPIEPAKVDVTVTQATWATKIVEKTFE